jgi:hypothetical protein
MSRRAYKLVNPSDFGIIYKSIAYKLKKMQLMPVGYPLRR